MVTRARRWLLVAALAAWALLGAARAARQHASEPRTPAWERHLAPLREAPLPPGSAVALLAAAVGGSREGLKPVLMEAAWQRPDLRWAPLEAWPPGAPADALVTVGAAAPPPGWSERWRRGGVAVLVRERR